MRLLPKLSGNAKGVDLEFFPPSSFIAGLMELAVMASAERDGELVADFDSQCARLCEAEMVRVARVATAYKARLGSHEAQMGFVASALGFGQGKNAFVDLAGETSVTFGASDGADRLIPLRRLATESENS